MRVIRFNKDKHFADLLACLTARKAYIPTLREMPKVGYVTYEGDTIIAAAFLRKVEGGYGQIDGLTSNPYATAEQRHAGIDLAVSAIIAQSKKLNINNVLFISVDESTIMRSQKYGFKKLPLSVLAADLNTRSV